MAGCSRCGQNRVSRPITMPSVVGRPGGVSIPAQRPVGGINPGLATNTIHNAITNLRYIPNNGSK